VALEGVVKRELALALDKLQVLGDSVELSVPKARPLGDARDGLEQPADGVAGLCAGGVRGEPVGDGGVDLRVHVGAEEGSGDVPLLNLPVVVRSQGEEQTQ
jgi:hypothetical protein